MTKKQIPAKPKATTVALPADPIALRKLKISLGIIVGVFAFLLYAQSIGFDYTMDDHPAIDINKVTTKGFAGIPTLLKTDYWYGFRESARGPIYRPTSLIMFAIEWQLFPHSPHINHFMNVLLFAVTGYVLFLLLCKLFEKYSLVFPFVCSLLYITHPIHTEVVNNIKSRDEILCYLFGILAMFCFTKSISKHLFLNIFLGCLCFFLSVLSKETGITFLIIIPLTLFIFTDKSNKKLLIISILLIFVTGIYLLLREHVLKSIDHDTPVFALYNSVVMAPDFVSRQATVFYILLRYILLLIFPYTLTCDYNFAMVTFKTLSDIPAITGILVNSALGIFAIINLRKKSVFSYGILFYFITLAPVSNMFVDNGATMAERFMYVPSLGFCIVISLLLIRLTKTEIRNNSFKNLGQFFSFNSSLFIIVFIITGLYSFKTFSRSMDWKDNITIFAKAAEVSDNSATAHGIYGYLLMHEMYPVEKDSIKKIDEVNKAIDEYNKALKIYPQTNTYSGIASCYFLKKNYEKSKIIYQSIINSGDDNDTADLRILGLDFYNLGLQMNSTEQYEKALSIFDSAIKYVPNFSNAYNSKGATLLHQMKFTEALEVCQKAIQLDSNNVKAFINVGCAYSNLRLFPLAIEYLNKAHKMDTTDPNPFYFLGITYQNMGDDLNAKEYFDKAKNLNKGQ